MSKNPAKKRATCEKPESCKPQFAIPLPFKDAVRGPLPVDPKSLPPKQPATGHVTVNDDHAQSPKHKQRITLVTKKTGAEKKK